MEIARSLSKLGDGLPVLSITERAQKSRRKIKSLEAAVRFDLARFLPRRPAAASPWHLKGSICIASDVIEFMAASFIVITAPSKSVLTLIYWPSRKSIHGNK